MNRTRKNTEKNLTRRPSKLRIECTFYTLKLRKDSDEMRIVIVVTCSSGIMKINIAVLAELNLEDRFTAFQRYSL